MNNLSVIIPSRTAANLVPCVEALMEREIADRLPCDFSQINNPSTRIIIVDDGLDPSFLSRPSWFLGQRIIQGEKPFVYARNCNLGIRAAGKDDVILLNDDALLKTSGGFTAMQRAAAEHPEYGIIGAVTNIVGNTNQWPQPGAGLREDPRMVCFVCVFIPRGTIERVGLLDEEFVGYGFDDDSYCLRVRRAGLKIGIFDGCFVDHGSLRSTFRGDPKQPADLRQNAAIFKQKYGADNWAL